MGEGMKRARAAARATRKRDYKFQLWQDGMKVAEVSSASIATARREIEHYAMIYRQDGEVEIRAVR
jgi:hypothetical protein